jgi:hypothetical protein
MACYQRFNVAGQILVPFMFPCACRARRRLENRRSRMLPCRHPRPKRIHCVSRIDIPVQGGLLAPFQEEESPEEGMDGPDIDDMLADIPVSSQWPQEHLAESPTHLDASAAPTPGSGSPPLPTSTISQFHNFSAAALYSEADNDSAFAATAPASMRPPAPDFPLSHREGQVPRYTPSHMLPPSGFARTLSADAVFPEEAFGWESAGAGCMAGVPPQSHASGGVRAPQRMAPPRTYSQVCSLNCAVV